jgi:hypothetical protein
MLYNNIKQGCSLPIRDITRVTTMASVKELLAAGAASGELTPSEGDRAYTVWQGTEYVGVLTSIGNAGVGITAIIVPEDPTVHWTGLEHRGFHVGHDEKIAWDDDRCMWYAPSDFD